MAIETLSLKIKLLNSEIGRLPNNQDELINYLGGKVPLSGWDKPLEYTRNEKNPNHYTITTLSPGFDAKIFLYNSQKENEGITIEPF